MFPAQTEAFITSWNEIFSSLLKENRFYFYRLSCNSYSHLAVFFMFVAAKMLFQRPDHK
jgi:hypothetical protein